MSGFIGIVNLDNAPVNRNLLTKLTHSMAYRGPDGEHCYSSGNVGLGHTMLRTGREGESEQQPCSLDGETWITADCRLDAREDLVHDLAALGRKDLRNATDPELILHAFAVWGPDCVQRLLGDFAFAISDAPNRRIFCARDQIGVKVFYYAGKSNLLIFGNTLNSLRLHPSVSNDLNEIAVGDFLLFGMNQDQSTTTFRDIQRLPPAHTLMWSGGELEIRRYWTFPIDPPVRYRHARDYASHFLELADVVVADRLHTDRVSVFMSGGLDSSGLAAIAAKLGAEVRANTIVFDRLIPDQERYYAGTVAKHLGISIEFQVADDYHWYDANPPECPGSPDPMHVYILGPGPRLTELGAAAKHAPVALYGEGPDNALSYEWKPYVSSEWKSRQFFSVLKEVVAFPFIFGGLPFTARISKSASKKAHPAEDGFPQWLNADFAERCRLRDRWSDIQRFPEKLHPTRPRGYASCFSDSRCLALWQKIFEGFDAGVTGVPVDVRHPYMDLRMLRFLFSVPALPWCRDKHLLRSAFRDYLPQEVLGRPKAGVAGSAEFARYAEIGFPEFPQMSAASAYIDASRVRRHQRESPESLWLNLRPSTLARFISDQTGCNRGSKGIC